MNNDTLNGYVNLFLASKLKVEFNNVKYNEIDEVNGKVIYDQANNAYYKISVKLKYDPSTFTVSTSDEGGYETTTFINNNLVRINLNDHGVLQGNLRSGDVYMVGLKESTRYIELERMPVSVKTTITKKADRLHLQDSPYDMFCIPYSDDIQMTDGTDVWTCSKAVATSIATAIGEKSGSRNIYDIQLLPYCPNQQLVIATPDPSVLLDVSACQHDLVVTTESTPRKITAVIWCPKSTFSFDLDNPSEAATFDGPYLMQNVSQILNNTKYVMPEMTALPSGVSRTAITYSNGNGLALYRVSKSTKNATYETDIKVIELLQNNGTNTLVLSKESGGSIVQYLSLTLDQYNALDYMYMFEKSGTDSVSTSWPNTFLTKWRLPKIHYYGLDLSTPESAKMSNDCSLYRLSAGNYSAIFEFSPAKSFGFDGFRVDCTYKPYSPWIHVIPKLKGLYGADFANIDDSRGLICGGDYSLPQITNEWANYQLSNKTYQDVFDRQIKNMDVNNAIARQEQNWQSLAGTISAGAGGATTGLMLGGVPGAVAGALVGSTAGAIGGALDYENLVKRQNEAKSYATDMFNYSLQNIKAIPNALAKTSALVANTKIWPFLEIFECTDREKKAYLDKLEYDGMTIMAIGKLSDYIVAGQSHYFKGDIIRMPTIKEDSHVVDEIYTEIKKGVYI